MQGLALVDYDNVGGEKNRSKADVELHAASLLDMLRGTFQAVFPDVRELDVRFYGGWIDERGQFSPKAFWLLQALPVLRGRRDGVIMRPSLATTMVQFPDVAFRGTVRLRSTPKRQKMVDGMLGCDAMFAAAMGPTRIGLITDDEDLVPAALSAHAKNTNPVALMRSRPFGKGMNDRILADRGLQIHCFRGEQS